MSVQIHYDGATYVEVEHDLDDTIGRITQILNSSFGAGVVRVTTRNGTVDLLISRTIPLAVEYKNPSERKPARVL